MIIEPTSELIADPSRIEQPPNALRFGRHIPALDGLRGAAVLLVMLSHFINFYPPPSNVLGRAVRAVLGLGWCGVDLFFVLSGFLITGILVDAKNKPAEQYFRTFYVRRILRIFPVYYCFLTLLLLLTFVLPTITDRHELTWYFLYLQNWRHAFGIIPAGISHFWSLAIEEQFYVVWPLVIYHTKKDSLLRVIAATFGVAQLLRLLLVLQFSVSSVFLYTATVTRLDGILLGSFLAIALRDPYWLPRIRKCHLLCGGAAAIALLVLAGASHTLRIFERVTPFVMFAPISFAILFSSVLVAIILTGRGPWNWKWLQASGKYSYAMYVFHYPLFAIATSEVFRRTVFDDRTLTAGSGPQGFFWGTVLLAGCSLATFFAAKLSWWILESRMIALKDRLT